MNDRVKAYRAKQKAAGLSQVSVWLDAPTAQLLKQAAAAQQRLPGEIVAAALQSWWGQQGEHAPPVSAEPATTTVPITAAPAPAEPDPAVTPDPTLLRALVQQMVQEALAANTTHPPPSNQPTPAPEPPHDPLPRPSLYRWPMSF